MQSTRGCTIILTIIIRLTTLIRNLVNSFDLGCSQLPGLLKRRTIFVWLSSFTAILTSINCLLFPASAFADTRLASATVTRPKLVLFLIADQFPYNYFSLCANKFQPGGFRYLLDNGANFTHCQYLGTTNQTASNLAVIATGAYPWSNGIIGNQWYDRRKQKVVKATSADENTPGSDVSTSPGRTHTLIGTTIGDELKISSSGLSRVISLSCSDQDAILFDGKLGDHAFWWDCHAGNFASVVRFGNELPDWTKKFNERHYCEQYFGKPWQPLVPSSPTSTYDIYQKAVSAGDKNYAYLINNSSLSLGEGFYNQFMGSPWANQMLFDFAQEAIEQESLGKHNTPDLLAINFSSFEIVGKNYGSYSQESQDLVLRFDQSLADFLKFLDRKAGLTNCLIVFTACHGGPCSPELMRTQGLEAGIIDAKAFKEQLNTALSSRLGSANWIESFEPPNLYLNLSAIDHHNYHQPDIEKLAANLAHSISGTGEIYSAFQLFMNQLPNGPLVKGMRKSYFWGRSGELYVLPKPEFAFASETDTGASGSPYNYDVQVPLLIFGNSIRAGSYASAISPADIAPTVANILNICSPSVSEGRVLQEALSANEKSK